MNKLWHLEMKMWLIICIIIINAQIASSQIRCKTPAPTPPAWIFQTPSASLQAMSNVTNVIPINVFIHILRSSSGYSYTQPSPADIISDLNSDFSSSGIQFTLLGSENIDNDRFYHSISEDRWPELFSQNVRSNAVNIYVLATYSPTFSYDGLSLSIPSNECYMQVNGSHFYSHLMGHCFGLYHIYHGTVKEGSDLMQCSELVNGSNSKTCGDYIVDTPADPDYWYFGYSLYHLVDDYYVGGTATDANGQEYKYDPNQNNIMGEYSNHNMFTPLQIQRMRMTILNTPVLQNTIIYSISGNSLICSQNTYTLNFLCPGSSVTWTHSSNLSEVSGQGTAQYTVSKLSDGAGWVQATVNGIALPQYGVWAGTAFLPAINGNRPYVWINAYVHPYGVVSIKEFHLQKGQDINLRDENVDNYGGSASQFHWEWENGNGGGGANMYNYDDGQILFEPYELGSYRIRTKVTDACGTATDWSTPVCVVVEDENSLALTPNPASSEVQVNLSPSVPSIQTISSQARTSISSPYSVQIVDSYGKIKYVTTKKAKKFTLLISSLPNGLYTVIVSYGKKIYQKKLFVKH